MTIDIKEPSRPAFEEWLRKHPDTRFWNTTDAMFAAFIGGEAIAARLEQPSAPSVVTDEQIDAIWESSVAYLSSRQEQQHARIFARALLSRTAPAIHFVSRNDGSQPEDTAHLDCPACGGSGHIDDYTAAPEVDAEARDAARYRWFRQRGEDFGSMRIMDSKGNIDPEALDGAIDAAIAAQKERT